MVELTRKENSINVKNRGIIELLNAFNRYYSRRKVKSNSRKLSKIRLEKIAKKIYFKK